MMDEVSGRDIQAEVQTKSQAEVQTKSQTKIRLLLLESPNAIPARRGWMGLKECDAIEIEA